MRVAFLFTEKGVVPLGVHKSMAELIIDFVEEYGALRTRHLYAAFPCREAKREIQYLLNNKRLFQNVGGEFISDQLPIEPVFSLMYALDVLFERFGQPRDFGKGDAPVEIYAITKDGVYVEITCVEKHDETHVISTLENDSDPPDLQIFIIEDLEQARRIQSLTKNKILYALKVKAGGFNYLEFD